jgi:hypothetical protein
MLWATGFSPLAGEADRLRQAPEVIGAGIAPIGAYSAIVKTKPISIPYVIYLIPKAWRPPAPIPPGTKGSGAAERLRICRPLAVRCKGADMSIFLNRPNSVHSQLTP